ncbi:MAG: M48 family metallopeptidase [Proteobacteria bacterium]|nr:M48 family metallopeptidase [Pseudomonadota bacterium]
MTPARRLVAAFLAALLAGQSAPVLAQQRAPGARPADNTDEGGIWAAMDKAEIDARASADVNRDPQLNAYVKGVFCKLAPEYCGDVRIYVMDRPYYNAAMAPNGYMEVWSGTLLRARSEDELAFVLGHEVTHYAENHSLQTWRAMKNRAAAFLGVQVGAALLGAAAARSAGTAEGARAALDTAEGVSNVIYLGTIASLFRFSRDNETEADRLGMQRAVSAGYAADTGVGMFKALQAETKASQFFRVRNSERRLNIFGSHPLTAERLKQMETLAPMATPDDPADRRAYRARIRPHLAAWIRDDMRRKDFGQSLHLLDQLAADGEDAGILGFYKGEAYRLRRETGDLERARAAYQAASAHPDAPVQTWRELGEAHRKAGDKAAARGAFTTYLERAPQAEDRWLVEATLAKL